MFKAALFTIAKTEGKSKCPSTDEQITKTCHTHTHTHVTEYYSEIKEQNRIMPSEATWTDLETVLLDRVSQKQKANTV